MEDTITLTELSHSVAQTPSSFVTLAIPVNKFGF